MQLHKAILLGSLLDALPVCVLYVYARSQALDLELSQQDVLHSCQVLLQLQPPLL